MEYTITINSDELEIMKKALSDLEDFYDTKAAVCEVNGWKEAQDRNDEKARTCMELRYMLEGTKLRKETDNFYGDEEKMVDFRIMPKDEFLRSYSYLTEEEYDNTARIWWYRRYLS